eukprot:814901_1
MPRKIAKLRSTKPRSRLNCLFHPLRYGISLKSLALNGFITLMCVVAAYPKSAPTYSNSELDQLRRLENIQSTNQLRFELEQRDVSVHWFYGWCTSNPLWRFLFRSRNRRHNT